MRRTAVEWLGRLVRAMDKMPAEPVPRGGTVAALKLSGTGRHGGGAAAHPLDSPAWV